jgi:hypothetical protein
MKINEEGGWGVRKVPRDETRSGSDNFLET